MGGSVVVAHAAVHSDAAVEMVAVWREDVDLRLVLGKHGRIHRNAGDPHLGWLLQRLCHVVGSVPLVVTAVGGAVRVHTCSVWYFFAFHCCHVFPARSS